MHELALAYADSLGLSLDLETGLLLDGGDVTSFTQSTNVAYGLQVGLPSPFQEQTKEDFSLSLSLSFSQSSMNTSRPSVPLMHWYFLKHRRNRDVGLSSAPSRRAPSDFL